MTAIQILERALSMGAVGGQMTAIQVLERVHEMVTRQLSEPAHSDAAMLVGVANVIEGFAGAYNLPEIKTCIDITAEKLERYVEGQARWDPRGELLMFKNTDVPCGVMWLSQRGRIAIHALSVDGVGVTKGDKYRLSLRNRHEGRKEHRRWNEAKKANPKA